MVANPRLRRIGVVDLSSTGWLAAAAYSSMTLRSLRPACERASVELYFISPVAGTTHVPADFPAKRIQLRSAEHLPGEQQLRSLFGMSEKSHPFRGEQRLRNLLDLADNSSAFSVARENSIDVLLPVLDVPQWRIGPKTLGWVPDFQHVYFPEFFNQAELQRRNSTIRRLGERASLIVLSSQAARSDFAAFAPEYSHKARVVPFPSLLAFEPRTGDPTLTSKKYMLPEKFALVANQFWVHKNHGVVVEALDHLHRRGLDVSVVMTGLPADQRDPSNKNLSSILQAIATAGLNKHITILGQVPYEDLVNLTKTAALIIQPSRFEGWSTVVQDAKALGRPVVCSDIPVHREQAPKALGFFPCDDPEVLANFLSTHWESLLPGPDPDLEAESLGAERDFAIAHGQALLKLCREACG